MPIKALVLAGRRSVGDLAFDEPGVTHKALVPIAGVPMLERVVRTLEESGVASSVSVSTDEPRLVWGTPYLAKLAEEDVGYLHHHRSGTSPAASVADFCTIVSHGEPVLVTTADNVLLTPSMIDEFLTGADGSDVAVAMVERAVLLSRYPQSKRTWLKFRGGWWSGANLFRLRGRRVLPLLDFWGRIERDRKKGRKIVAAFGPFLLVGALLRLFTIQQGVARAGLRFGLKARVVPMSEAEACIDADKPIDVELIEQIFANRQVAASALSTAATASASSSS